MKQIAITYPDDKTLMYRLLRTQLTGLVDGVPHLTANLANTSALLAGALRDINWVGFYLLKDDTLILGPFQGKPACVEIKVGKESVVLLSQKTAQCLCQMSTHSRDISLVTLPLIPK